MQLQVFFKTWHAHEFFERRFAHLHGMGKSHVIFDQSEDLVCVAAGKSQTMADFLCHFHTNVDMAIEADAIRSNAKGRRLANVMQQGAPSQGCGAGMGKSVEQQKCVNKNIALGMKLRRLLDSFHRLDLGKNFVQKPSFIKQKESLPCMAFDEHFCKLVANPLARNLVNLGCKLLN